MRSPVVLTSVLCMSFLFNMFLYMAICIFIKIKYNLNLNKVYLVNTYYISGGELHVI